MMYSAVTLRGDEGALRIRKGVTIELTVVTARSIVQAEMSGTSSLAPVIVRVTVSVP
jgi:hypothetical protein